MKIHTHNYFKVHDVKVHVISVNPNPEAGPDDSGWIISSIRMDPPEGYPQIISSDIPGAPPGAFHDRNLW